MAGYVVCGFDTVRFLFSIYISIHLGPFESGGVEVRWGELGCEMRQQGHVEMGKFEYQEMLIIE